MNKFSVLFLIATLSSLVLNPLFINNGIPEGLTVISQALGQESSDSDSDSNSNSLPSPPSLFTFHRDDIFAIQPSCPSLADTDYHISL